LPESVKVPHAVIVRADVGIADFSVVQVCRSRICCSLHRDGRGERTVVPGGRAGPNRAFTLQSVKADLIDMASIESSRLFSYSLGIGTRPTRYALICEESDQATQAENAASELQVRRQLVDNKSGSAYNGMIAGIDRGDAQPVFILSRFAPGGAKLCAVKQYWNQECTCGGQYKATERSRIPASELFGPQKLLN
jgi:hypothetical protein